jgi:predicted ATPase
MIKNSERFIVITGGPGSGKSSLIDALHGRGYSRSVEAGRAIIQDQVAIGGRALPWSDRALFAEMMLCWELRSYRIAQQAEGIVFFDRGIPDVVGYLMLCGVSVPEHMKKAVSFRYNRQVFIAPPWEMVFEHDGERKQDFEEAVRTYDAMVSTYTEFGYELIELPRVAVALRVQFVLHQLGIVTEAE